MSQPPDPQQEKINQLAQRVDQIRESLRPQDPYRLADRVGAQFRDGQFHLHLWGSPVVVTHPGFIALHPGDPSPLSVDVQALLAYHFQASDGLGLTARWLAFSELPDGRFYAQAYQSYSGALLVRKFGSDLSTFQAAAERAGGERLSFADAAYAFPALPKVHLLAAYWLGDDDFPPNAQISFDANASRQLPTDVCAILGGMLARRIVRA